MITVIFCIAQVLIYLYTFTDKLSQKLIGVLVPVITAAVVPLFPKTIDFTVSEFLPDEPVLTENAVVSVEDTDIAEITISNTGEDSSVLIHAHAYGTTSFNLKDGDDEFKRSKGDLNCGAEGAYLYLYYTKDAFPDKRGVKDVWFNDEKSGSVSSTDLNKGASGDYIYMHVSYMHEEEQMFGDPSSAFTYYASGRGTMHFKLLTSTYDYYRTLHWSTFWLKDEVTPYRCSI